MVSRKTSSRNSSAEPRFAIAIMAAGKGTRLKSKHPKVMHEIGGKPLLQYVVDAAKAVLPANDVFVIIGHEAERVREAMAGTGVQFVLQAEQLGTGHAIMSARQALKGYDDVLVLSGDVPLLRAETIRAIRDFHLKNNAAMTILTADFPNPAGYGRIVRKKKGGRQSDEVEAIVEQKKLTPQQEKIRESNSGIYAFATKPLFEHLSELRTDNPHGEYYLTDVAAILAKKKATVLALKAGSQHEVAGANNRAELAQLDAEARARKAAELMAAGVTIFRPETCVIDAAVEVGPDTIIEPFVQLLGGTRIGADCRIQSYSVITSSEIGDGVQVRHGCIITDSRVAPSAVIGPYSHLRPGSDIGPEAHVGNFVETKKAKLGRGAKANHLTYLGDAVIGERVNVGAGTITCNYDGVHKHITIIEDGAFIGSDSTLVAPVRVGRNAYVGAAACVTEDVPEDALAIARARQVNKPGWAKVKREEIAAKTKP
ncbi:MAG TPA: bifunctional UDP-N-acetylglucosamine diphosphorylase/glucosamine-1-phosphate N-acetyltransferase GlmU [Terriglobales bacterium]|nr:bifunctional UDP-N-acetylglucosamine diphosphorylase/glucosamine-1-phosphate N-acetyltransferase GlmU [Terriglobales bacterium]